MCIIVYKPANEKFPSWKTLKNCFENNPDGAGFMFADEFGVHLFKGFMDWQSFKNALKPHKAKGFSYPFVVHFRITTHGGTSQEMTQPFPLERKERKLRSLNINCDVGVAHNGIITMTADAKQMSDTAEFIQKYLTTLITHYTYYKNPRIAEIIEELIKWSNKMCILSKDGHVELIGNFIEKDGIYYSNETFKESYYKKVYNYPSRLYDDYEFDAYNSGYGCSKYGSQKWYDPTVDCQWTNGNDEVCIGCPNFEFCYYYEEN